VGLHLLDFDLFTKTAAERKQAIWRFEMHDGTKLHISLWNVLQMSLIKLSHLPEGPLHAWSAFFKHWQEDGCFCLHPTSLPNTPHRYARVNHHTIIPKQPTAPSFPSGVIGNPF
jgi:hypothetical protein